jgi:hypothetical protein
MPVLRDAAAADALLVELRREARNRETVQEACQGVMQSLAARLSESLVLARVYMTVPWQNLPEADRVFARTVAGNLTAGHLLRNDTRVLSLLGTAGVEPEWRDRYSSRNHLAIPLLSPEFVAEIPMVAGLLDQLGSSVRWYGQMTPSAGRDTFGVFTGTFFVGDARTGRDHTGRLLIPAQDFVQHYGIRSVFGVGGQFHASGIILACIFFSNVTLEETPAWLLRVPVMIASVTQPLLDAGRIYPGVERTDN